MTTLAQGDFEAAALYSIRTDSNPTDPVREAEWRAQLKASGKTGVFVDSKARIF